MHRQPTKN